MIVGAAIAWSAAAPWIMLTVLAAFFARQPLKVYWLSRRNPPVAALSLRFLLLFLTAAAVGLVGIARTAPEALYPLVLALPIAAQQSYADLARRSRSLAAELAGAVAISSSAAMLALAGGLALPVAVGLWLLFACRSVPSILYVRNRLLLEKGKAYDMVLPGVSHVLAVCVTTLLWSAGFASALTLAVFVFLTVRSVVGLSTYRTKMKAMKIGIWEVIYGAVTIGSMIVGFYLGV
jgi:hypothetical protein